MQRMDEFSIHIHVDIEFRNSIVAIVGFIGDVKLIGSPCRTPGRQSFRGRSKQAAPDARELVFSSIREGHQDLYRKAIGGDEEELLYHSAQNKGPFHWSKDGLDPFLGWRKFLSPTAGWGIMQSSGAVDVTGTYEG